MAIGLTPGVTRIVRDGARASIDSKIYAATNSPSRQDVRDAQNTAYFDRQMAKKATEIGPITPSEKLALTDYDPDDRFAGVTPADNLGNIWGWGGEPIAALIDPPTAPVVETVTPVVEQRVQTGNPSQDDLRSRMAASERDAQEYAGLIRNYTDAIDEANALQLAAIQEGAMDIAAQYDEKINELKGRIADARVGLADAMAAYKHYFAQTGPAAQAAIDSAVAGEAARSEVMDGRAAAIEAGIEKGYAQSAESLAATAELIGAGEVVLSGDLQGAVDKFGDMIKDAASGRIEDIDAISEAAALFATAQAKAIKAQDEFTTDLERQETEIQIQSQIDKMLDNVVSLEKDKEAAVQAALDQYDPMGYGSAEESWDAALDQFISGKGWSMEEEALVRQMLEKMGGATTREDALEWLMGTDADPGVMIQARYDALVDYVQSVTDDPLEIESADGQMVPSYLVGLMQAVVRDPEDKMAIANLGRRLGDGFSGDTLAGIFREADANFDGLLDVLDLRTQHNKKWNEARAATAASGGGSQAVNNYANRNEPAYVARRNIGVPTFVNSFLSAFGKSGTGREYVGGVTSSYKGALRSPSATGGGKSSNSDHLSGGAIDLYGDTVAELEAIERWARSQPGVSLVVYSGNKYHETGVAGGASAGNNGRGHVHVSLQVGYW